MIRIYNDDCLKVLLRLAERDVKVDAIITDPPFGISCDNNISRKYINDIRLYFGDWDHFETDNEYLQFSISWMKPAFKMLKKGSWSFIFFDSLKIGMISNIAEKHSLKQRSLYAWVKSNPPCSYRKYNLVSGVEYAWVGSKGECRIPNFLNQKEMYNYDITPNKGAWGITEHPTEKHPELARKYVKIFSKKGDTVLDPFSGSGAFAEACALEGRNYIGCEIQTKWYDKTRERYKNALEEIKVDQSDFSEI